MKKSAFLAYGILCYLAFLGTIFYAIGFVGNFVVPKTIDGEPEMSRPVAILINALLLLVFALQHSLMARPSFKLWFMRIVPEPIERSTYVLLASLCLMLLMWQWQPIGGVIWQVENDVAVTVLMMGYVSGWAIVFVSTFLINHFDLFGLRQVWLYFNDKPYTPLAFELPLFYRIVRHPLYFGFLVAFWCAPLMTFTHLLFAVLTTAYILTAIRFEEKDLVRTFGEKYLNYRKWAPMIIPFMKRKSAKHESK